MNKTISDALSSTLTELNLDYDSTELLDEGLLDYLKSAGASALRGGANLGRNASIAAQNAAKTTASAVSNAAQNVGDNLGTDASIIRNGLLLVNNKDNSMVGIRGVAANSPEANDILKRYQAKGFVLASPEQRQLAANQKINMINPDQLDGNIKAEVVNLGQALSQAATQLVSEINHKTVITASSGLQSLAEIAKLLSDFNQHVKTELANSAPGTPEQVAAQPPVPPSSAPTNQVAQPQAIVNPPVTTTTPNNSTNTFNTTAAPAPEATPTPTVAKNLLPPPAPETHDLATGANQLSSPEVKQRLQAAANKDAALGESRIYIDPLLVF